MKKVEIEASLIGEEKYFFQGKGLYDDKKKEITYQDDFATIHLYFEEDLFVRETKEGILSYKFLLDGDSHFEVYVKELKKGGKIPLTTKKLEKKNNSFEVIYHIEGNPFDHHYKIEWRL